MAATKKQDTQAKTTKANESGNILFIFTYFLGWLSGIIIYITEGNNSKRFKFHALQAIFLSVVATILYFLPIVGWLITALLWVYGLYIGLVAYGGKDLEVPVLGEWARKYST